MPWVEYCVLSQQVPRINSEATVVMPGKLAKYFGGKIFGTEVVIA